MGWVAVESFERMIMGGGRRGLVGKYLCSSQWTRRRIRCLVGALDAASPAPRSSPRRYFGALSLSLSLIYLCGSAAAGRPATGKHSRREGSVRATRPRLSIYVPYGSCTVP